LRDNNGNDNSYDKIKHLVEVDDDILAVFVVESAQIRDLHIAKNANIDRMYVDSIFNKLNFGYGDESTLEEKGINDDNRPLGKLVWVILEYENLRILKIIDKGKIIMVLVNSRTKLQHTIDNILGYYYDADETPKSLF
jgi:hypothetical protein